VINTVLYGVSNACNLSIYTNNHLVHFCSLVRNNIFGAEFSDMAVTLRHPRIDTSADKVQWSKTKWDYFSDIFGLFKKVYVDGKLIYTRYPVSKFP